MFSKDVTVSECVWMKSFTEGSVTASVTAANQDGRVCGEKRDIATSFGDIGSSV